VQKAPELESGLLQGRSLHVLLISGGAFMAQEESQEIKELRSEMRKGRLPLLKPSVARTSRTLSP